MGDNMKKSNYFKWIILIADVIAIALLIVAYNKWHSTKTVDKDTNEVVEKEYRDVRFKNFIFKISDEVEYTTVDEHNFKLKSDYYEADIEPFLHNDTNMLKYPELYYNEMTGMGTKLTEPENYKVGLIDLIKYVKMGEEKETTLYYVNYNENFDFEIELFNGEEKLGEILNVIINAKYDYDSNEIYDYMMCDYEEEVKNQ